MQNDMLSAPLVLLILGLFGALIQTHLELTRLKQRYQKYDALTSKEGFEQQLDSKIFLKQNELADLETQHTALATQTNELQRKLLNLKEDELVRSLDFYQPYYYFPEAKAYKDRLKQVKLEQKKMESDSTAVMSQREWTVEGDKRKGKKLIETHIKLVLEVFTKESKFAVSKVNSTNVQLKEKSISSVFNKLNKLSEVTHCEINQEYLDWWLRELQLTYEMKEKEREEKDQKRFLDEQRKREKKEQLAFEKARREAEEAEQREKQHQVAIEKVSRELEKALGQQRRELELQLKELEELRSAAQADKENAIQRGRNSNTGYIFVISSVRSLGHGVYRICMTERDEEDTYIRNLNPAIPFPFDIHFKVYSESISYTLGKLHERFSDCRVNQFNSRREFFHISLEEIEREINNISEETGLFKSIQRFD